MNPAPRHGVRIRALGDDRWRLQCAKPRCPADVTKTTSIGGVRAFVTLHRGPPDPDALITQALQEAAP